MELSVPFQEVLGWAAAALTLLAFSCNDLLRLRYSALAANAAFIAYGLTAGLWPVLALHFVLVPVNVWRLFQTKQLLGGRHPRGLAHHALAAAGAGRGTPGDDYQRPGEPAQRSPRRRARRFAHSPVAAGDSPSGVSVSAQV
jgi:hypothetical protein